MTTSEQPAVQVSSSSQTSPQVRSSPAGLVYNPRLRANSGKQDGRDFNNRGGERGRQPTSFRSCVEDSEHTDQKTAQVASAPPGLLSEVKTKTSEIRQKVDRNRARWIRLGYEWFSRRIQPASHPAKRGDRQAAGRSQQGRDRESRRGGNQSR